MNFRKPIRIVLPTVLASLLVASCGGGGGGGSSSSSNSANSSNAGSGPPVSYSIGGTVTGLAGNLVLQDNGGDDLVVTTNGGFAFSTRIADSQTYNITIRTQPLGQTCSVSSGSGTVSGNNVRSAAIVCAANAYAIGGTVSGLSGSLIIANSGGDRISVVGNGAFSFPTLIAFGASYQTTILVQPAGQTCSISGSTGTVSGPVGNIAVTCSSNAYTVGGTVAGLTGTIVLQDNGGDSLTLSTNGGFSFPIALNYGASYNVSVVTQPNLQTCSVASGSGTVTGHISGITVTCASSQYWTWIGGNAMADHAGVYGTKGVAAPDNIPGARTYAASAQDSAGRLWLFGGIGISQNGIYDPLNDLWMFDGAQWTWVSGSGFILQTGVYGTRGVADVANVPGGRAGSTMWFDRQGRLWLFGGEGRNPYAPGSGYLNDMWMFDGTQWTWVTGSSMVDQPGVYGTQGVAADGNTPGARRGAVSWVDRDGSLCLFGGRTYSNHGNHYFNDLWKFDGSRWTWSGGSQQPDQPSIYGTRGLAEATNIPHARSEAVVWLDSTGIVWLFGGQGYDPTGTSYGPNELWKFDGTMWAWVGGNSAGGVGIYGTKGVASSGNTPGARSGAAGWVDNNDNLWLFSGNAKDRTGSIGLGLNDLWKFDGSRWTWVGGSDVDGTFGNWGTIGVAAPSNMPSDRVGAVAWKDSMGRLWLFGGAGSDFGWRDGWMNDYWQFQP